MLELLSSIRIIGFDLDGTLYKNTPEIEEIINLRIAEEMNNQCPELGNIEEVKNIHKKDYEQIGSRTQAIKKRHIIHAEEIVYSALFDNRIIDKLNEDKKLKELLYKLHQRYKTFLITGSPKDCALSKLERLGIKEEVFDYLLFGDTSLPYKKIDGSVFEYFLRRSRYSPENHLYVGDNIRSDICPTKKLGMKNILVGKESEEADFSIKNIYEIENLLL